MTRLSTKSWTQRKDNTSYAAYLCPREEGDSREASITIDIQNKWLDTFAHMVKMPVVEEKGPEAAVQELGKLFPKLLDIRLRSFILDV
jgi:hypothetical protein